MSFSTSHQETSHLIKEFSPVTLSPLGCLSSRALIFSYRKPAESNKWSAELPVEARQMSHWSHHYCAPGLDVSTHVSNKSLQEQLSKLLN